MNAWDHDRKFVIETLKDIKTHNEKQSNEITELKIQVTTHNERINQSAKKLEDQGNKAVKQGTLRGTAGGGILSAVLYLLQYFFGQTPKPH